MILDSVVRKLKFVWNSYGPFNSPFVIDFIKSEYRTSIGNENLEIKLGNAESVKCTAVLGHLVGIKVFDLYFFYWLDVRMIIF